MKTLLVYYMDGKYCTEYKVKQHPDVALTTDHEKQVRAEIRKKYPNCYIFNPPSDPIERPVRKIGGRKFNMAD